MIWDAESTKRNEKIWIINKKDDLEIKALSAEAGITEFMAEILLDRGIKTARDYQSFLNCSTAKMHDPFLFTDMKKAVNRILLSVRNKEKILIYGDYDVDGVTSVSVLMLFFKWLGADAHYFIPNRKEDGYGISKDSANRFIDDGYSIMITVDCGITAVDEIDYINKSGMDVILTDHHTPQKNIPKAYAVIATETEDCTYPFKKLAGAGIAFKLIQAVCMQMGCEEESFKYLEIVALGTIADIVPLLGENRIFVKEGLKRMASTDNIGIQTILSMAMPKNDIKNVDEGTLGFIIAPRINAAGRLEHAKVGVELLIATNKDEAVHYAGMLEKYNTQRKEIENEVLIQSIRMIEESDMLDDKVIVLAAENWNQGVIGIVASRLVDRYHRSAVLFSIKGDIAKGSGRSINGFDLFKALSYCEKHLITFGGHEQAAGLTVSRENIDVFRAEMNQYASECVNDEVYIPKVFLSGEIAAEDLTIDNAKMILRLAPFGEKNRLPILMSQAMKVISVRKIGIDGKHIKAELYKDNVIFNAIGFNMSERIGEFEIGSELDIACYVERNIWNNTEKMQLRLVDVRPNVISQIQKYYFDTIEDTLKYFLPQKVTFGIMNDSIFGGDSKKVLIVFNSFESVIKHIDSMIEKRKSNEIKFIRVGIQEIFCADYQQQEGNNIYGIVLNPLPNVLTEMKADHYVLAGNWYDEGYKKSILSVLKKNREIVFDHVEGQGNRNDVFVSKDDLRAIYQFLKMNSRNRKILIASQKLVKCVCENYKVEMNDYKMKTGLDVLEEVSLIAYEKTDEHYRISLNSLAKNSKIDLLKHSQRFKMINALDISDE